MANTMCAYLYFWFLRHFLSKMLSILKVFKAVIFFKCYSIIVKHFKAIFIIYLLILLCSVYFTQLYTYKI